MYQEVQGTNLNDHSLPIHLRIVPIHHAAPTLLAIANRMGAALLFTEFVGALAQYYCALAGAGLACGTEAPVPPCVLLYLRGT